jgi:hypothetical protein
MHCTLKGDIVKHLIVFASLYCLLATGLPHALAQGTMSSGVTATPVPPSIDPFIGGTWSILVGAGTVQIGVAGPNGTTVSELTVTMPAANGNFTAQYVLPAVVDMRMFDTISFVTSAQQTRIGALFYLVDTHGRRRWFQYILRKYLGWQQPVYSLSSYVGEDSGFDISSIAALYFEQGGMVPGDVIFVGSLALDTGLVDHCDYAANWNLDLVSAGTLTTSSDAITGGASVLANVSTVAFGQADIAILGSWSGINWNWTGSTYVSFYFKDDNPSMFHYFLLYDSNRNYREWIFTNPTPGQWIKVTGNLTDNSYYQSGPVNLGSVQQFEVGVFGGSAFQNVAFQIDEVRVH